ncbi:hypothetical protein PAXRUDRAFT_501507 [Paxillus rubicundulus Ve08.2h10]|uniref:Uncharacterized protein n=1 Tax=Paxillus rubicundulus Ve08.2h10 TaxID=930991 RepID=A0A0D0D9D7_9AGAM|nr:hypothetical protein PAXRUDRAFT_501507 [Paxillus rubicundulus Ve08.2h10]
MKWSGFVMSGTGASPIRTSSIPSYSRAFMIDPSSRCLDCGLTTVGNSPSRLKLFRNFTLTACVIFVTACIVLVE